LHTLENAEDCREARWCLIILTDDVYSLSLLPCAARLRRSLRDGERLLRLEAIPKTAIHRVDRGEKRAQAPVYCAGSSAMMLGNIVQGLQPGTE